MSKAKRKVLIADSDFGEVAIERAIVEGAGFELLTAQCKSELELMQAGRDADAVLTQYAQVGERVLSALRCCRVIARYGPDVDSVDVAAATKRGIQVTYAPDECCADELADHTVALWLTLARKITEYDQATHRGVWRRRTGQPIWRLRGRVLGLLSFGAVARRIAERVLPFGVEIWAHDPLVDIEELEMLAVCPVSLEELLRGSDYLLVQAPLCEETHRLIDREALRMMKSTAVLINTAGGPIVEDGALYEALSNGWIAGAALDDLEQEPAKGRAECADNPLLRLRNLVITPHAAHYSEESLASLRRIAAEEAVRVLRGQPPRYPVNRLAPEQLSSPSL